MDIKKQFIRYVSQNMLGMLGMSLYILADTYFISKAVGADGITALNLVLPVYNLIFAIGAMIGVGSAIRFVIERNKENPEVESYFFHALFWAGIISLVFIAAGIFCPDQVIRLMGGDEQIIATGKSYTRIFMTFAPLFMWNHICNAFVRNDGSPMIAMMATLFSSLFNIVFDYILMFPFSMGMPGAALATALSPVVGMLICQLHFRSKKCTVSFLPVMPSLKRLIFSCQVGVSAFVGEISSGVITTAFNLIILRLAGNTGVAAYGVVANISLVAVALFNGISQGSQPLLSSFYGKADKKALEKVIGLSLRTAAVTAVCIYAVIYLWSEPIAGIFNQEHNEELAAMARFGLKLYFIGFFFAGINIVGTGILSAVESVKWAFTASVSRGFVMILLSAFTMSAVWGMTGIWLAFPAAEFITMGMTLAGIWGFFSKVNLVGKSL